MSKTVVEECLCQKMDIPAYPDGISEGIRTINRMMRTGIPGTSGHLVDCFHFTFTLFDFQ
jgi:hypothetical protein